MRFHELIAIALCTGVTFSAPIPNAINEVKAVFASADAVLNPVAREAVPQPKAVFDVAS